MPGPVGLPDAYRNVIGLRALRQYDERPLGDPDLHAILQAARWTGSSKNNQDWAVIAVTDPEQKGRLAECGIYTDPIRRAPLAFALVQESGGNEFDIGRLAQNIMLAASAIGVATCPVTFHRSDDASAVLGLPTGARCMFGVAAGYPAPGSGPSSANGRMDLDSFVHWNSY